VPAEYHHLLKPEYIESLLTGETITTQWWEFKIQLKWSFVAYLLGECANESIGYEVEDVLIAKKKEEVTPWTEWTEDILDVTCEGQDGCSDTVETSPREQQEGQWWLRVNTPESWSVNNFAGKKDMPLWFALVGRKPPKSETLPWHTAGSETLPWQTNLNELLGDMNIEVGSPQANQLQTLLEQWVRDPGTLRNALQNYGFDPWSINSIVDWWPLSPWVTPFDPTGWNVTPPTGTTPVEPFNPGQANVSSPWSMTAHEAAQHTLTQHENQLNSRRNRWRSRWRR
jgi:hypothetical protein